MPAREARSAAPDAQVAVVGAGPVGMTLAGRLAQRGVRTVLLEQSPELVSEGSRAICIQRETLEIWGRLGVGEAIAERGIQWQTARTYFRGRELFSVRLPGSGGDHFPPFVNISQGEVDETLLHRLERMRSLQILWGHRLTGLAQDADGLTASFDTPDVSRSLRAAYLVGTDGAHSSVRHLLGMAFPGHSHDDLFLVCDIRARLPFTNERHFHFDPPWNPGRQVLVHPQPDDVWRIDWQVPLGTDVDAERANGGLDRRIRAVIGDVPYELVWVTAYRFHQRLAERFRVGRVLLAGDAAHLMSPFGARGLNSGAADAENLAWKLALVASGSAPDRLLDSYAQERRAAALENLAVTDETMRFMVPRGPLSRALRNAILSGSLRFPALRGRVNSGRLAEPFSYAGSPVVVPGPAEPGLPRHGAVAPDFACRRPGPGGGRVSRLRDLLGGQFVALLLAGDDAERAAHLAVRASRLAWPAPTRVVAIGPERALRGVVVLEPADAGEAAAGLAAYADAQPRAWLIRPDGHLAGSVPLTTGNVDELARLEAVAIGALRLAGESGTRGRRRVARQRLVPSQPQAGSRRR